LTNKIFIATIELMTAEVMRPIVDPLVGDNISSYDLATSSPSTPDRKLSSAEIKLPLQVEINEKLLHLFGPDYTPAVAHRGLRERGRKLAEVISAVPVEQIDTRTIDIDTLSEIGDRSACLRITAGILATKYNINLQSHIERKLMHKMQIKYKPGDATEIRFWGTPENPGKKSGPEAFALLKGSYDSKREMQTYENRGLPIPDEEAGHRTPTLKFTGVFQDLAHWWQRSSLGSDFVPSERATNLISEGGEVDEALGVVGGLSKDQINSLSYENEADGAILDELAEELADIFIGSWCADAAFGIDSEIKDQERMKIAVEKYKDGPRLRKDGVALDTRLKHMDERYKREKMGLKPPAPLIVWHKSA